MLNRSVLDWPAGVTIHRPDKCYNGLTLVHGRGDWDPAYGISAQAEPRWNLVDMKGRVVHSLHGCPEDPARQMGSQLFEMLANGNFLSNGPWVTEQDWDGNVVCSISGDYEGGKGSNFHHDVQKTAAGTYIVLQKARVRDPRISKVELGDDRVREISAKGEVLWEWWPSQHFDALDLTDEGRDIIRGTGGGWYSQPSDWLHFRPYRQSCVALRKRVS